jgi:hypothetical protein
MKRHSRRHFLFTSACGFGGVALHWLLASEAARGACVFSLRAASAAIPPPRRSASSTSARSAGSVTSTPSITSQELERKRHGQEAGRTFDTFFGQPGQLLKSPFAFRRYGASGRWVFGSAAAPGPRGWTN